MPEYDKKHSLAGLKARLPKLEVLSNNFKGYAITIVIPEYSSVCPKSSLPDTGTITIKYEPNRYFIELKSLKFYILGYRNLGIFYENAVNRILKDFVRTVKPRWVSIRGDFNPRGGMTTAVEASYGRMPKNK